MKTTDPIWNELDRKSYARGMRYISSHACGGTGYHRTREAAERAAKRKARRACPANPPVWYVRELKAPAP